MIARNLLEWVADTPFSIAFLLIVLPAVVLSVVGILIVRFLHPEEMRINSEVAQAKVNYMAEIYAVLLGLFLVSAFEMYQDMQTVVRSEALALRALYQVTAQVSPEQPGALPDLVHAYTRSVIEDEWVLMKFGDASRITQQHLDSLFAAIAEAGQQSTATTGTAIQMEQLARLVLTQRADRLTNGPGVGRQLSDMLSGVLVVVTVIAISMPWFIYTSYATVHILLGTALIIVFVSLIIVAVKMLYPFAGELMIPPVDFFEALATMNIKSSP
ncbi:MAG TPA: hypothetical protein DCS21_04905 [Gammaproteobacteria bacterium]|nr:hypothetical protein [Gammaproteobacteria bacterium]